MLKRPAIATCILVLTAFTTSAAPEDGKPESPLLADIRVGVDVPRDCQDPHLTWTSLFPPLFYDPLFIWEPGVNGPRLKPCLADDWPEYSEDGLVCTIRSGP
jgi:ABC-type transport system substrate-binding protein